jgi:hypothetical protein
MHACNMSRCERFVAPSVKEGDSLGLYTQFQGLGMPSPASFFDTMLNRDYSRLAFQAKV